MKIAFFTFVGSWIGVFRASLVVFALGLLLAAPMSCPAGRTDCAMMDMAQTVENPGTCIIACGVLLPVVALQAPEFYGTISTLMPLNPLTGAGLRPEPALRPPRGLA